MERRDGYDDMNYIGFFRTREGLCEELERILDGNLLGFARPHAQV